MHKDLKNVLLSGEDTQNICKEMGAIITEDYKDRPFVCADILKGSVMFMADLIKRIDIYLSVDFTDVSSYHGGAESTEEIQMLRDLGASIEDKGVLIIRNILEIGTTLKSITGPLRSRKINSLEMATLLDKPSHRKANIEVKHVGRRVLDELVVGYGLDYHELYRSLPYIGTLKAKAYSK